MHSNESNRFLSNETLRALSKFRSEHELIFSLYLDLRSAQSAPKRFEELLRQAAEQGKLAQAPTEFQQQWNQEAERIRGWLRREQPRQGQGLAVFSSQPDELWHAFLLPSPVIDRLEIKPQIFTRPLEVLLGEHPCTLVALIDEGGARLVTLHLGQAEEITNIEAVPVTGARMDAADNPHVRAVVDMVQEAWAERGCGQLIIGGSTEMVDALREALPIMLQERLAGELALAPQTALEEILSEALEIDQARERQVESQRVDELITGASSETAVLGLEQTLMAVAGERKVRMLITEEDFREEGGECPNCGFLSADEQGICLMCGMSLRPDPDVIEAALKRVLDEGGEIEVLRSATSRDGLKDHGRIGALLFDPGTAPLREMETANQQTLAENGEIHPDTVHDETIQESFPASDPPGGW